MKKKSKKGNKGPQLIANAGAELREIREGRGLTMRDVHAESRKLAQKSGIRYFEIVPSRLHMLERGMHNPNLYRVQALSSIYKIGTKKMFELYGLKG